MKDLFKLVAEQTILTPIKGQPLRVIKSGKLYYAKLVENDNKIYISSSEEDTFIGLVTIKDFEKLERDLIPEDQILITKVNFNSLVGKIV